MASRILAVLTDPEGADRCLTAAYSASAALTHPIVQVLHVRADPMTTILPTEEMMTSVRRREIVEAEKRVRDSVKKVFDSASSRLGASSFEWVDVEGKEASEVVSMGGSADLLVVAAAGSRASGYAREAFHAALFEAHRPLLVVPAGYSLQPIRRMAIGWHGDENCRRTVQAAEPWLLAAEAIDVIFVDDGEPRSELEDAKRELARHKPKVTLRLVRPDGLSAGERLLAESRAADWIVIGGSEHGQIIDWLLQGNSTEVLRDSSVPIFTMH